MKGKENRRTLEEIMVLYARDRRRIRRRLREFRAVRSSEYFYELAYCLLTPQSSAKNAVETIRALRNGGFFENGFDPEPLLRRKECYIRFHKTKARHLLSARDSYPAIERALSNGSAGTELRKWLIVNVPGLGWKEASHLLRNIGYTGLAILDRHILKNLLGAGVLRRLPGALTAKRYLEIEREFQRFSTRVGIPMDELDLLFWSMETGEILK